MSHYRQRQGASMLEALIYVSLSAVLVSLTAQWFHVVFQVASRNKIRQRQHISLKQLASDLRTDVTSATGLSLTSPKQISLVTTGEEKIVYRVGNGEVDRVVGGFDEPTRQDVYRDLDDLRLEFVGDDSTDAAKFISLNVYRPVKQKKLKGTPQQSVSEGNVTERHLLQVRCCPIPAVQEAAE